MIRQINKLSENTAKKIFNNCDELKRYIYDEQYKYLIDDIISDLQIEHAGRNVFNYCIGFDRGCFVDILSEYDIEKAIEIISNSDLFRSVLNYIDNSDLDFVKALCFDDDILSDSDFDRLRQIKNDLNYLLTKQQEKLFFDLLDDNNLLDCFMDRYKDFDFYIDTADNVIIEKHNGYYKPLMV